VCLCYQAVLIGAGGSWEVNRQLNDTSAPCRWSCNLGWCLAEGNELEISAATTGSRPWITLLYFGKHEDIQIFEVSPKTRHIAN